MKTDKKRHIIKTITWRIIATLITFSFVFIFTKNIQFALNVSLFEILIKMLFYYLHERFWFKYIRFNKRNNIFKKKFQINKNNREKKYLQKPKVLWLTGLSGSGKSSIADSLEQKLFHLGYKTYILDGDNIRNGLNSDLTFSKSDRKENIRRISEISKLLVDSGTIVITSFISPYKEIRQMAKDIIGKDNYIEIFIDTSLETCIRRDVKGLYKKALSGEIKNFTGVDDNYDKPKNPDIVVDGNIDGQDNIDHCVEIIYNNIKNKI